VRELSDIRKILYVSKIERLFTYNVCFWLVNLVYSNNDRNWKKENHGFLSKFTSQISENMKKHLKIK
jgi:hypothetical protein